MTSIVRLGLIILALHTTLCFGNPTLLILGDSLSAAYLIPIESGWVHLLEQKVKASYPEAKTINRSQVGDTTANGLERLPNLLKEFHPQIVILELGGNDGLRGLPVDSIQKNLAKMIELCIENKAKVLLIGIKIPPNYGPQYTSAFNEIYPTLSKQYQIKLVPFLLENVALKLTLMQPDHIHPNERAQPILLENVWPLLSSLLEN